MGVDTAKTLIYGRLAVAVPGPGFVAIPRGIEAEVPDFFAQLNAERRVRKFRGGTAITRWIKRPGARNEALDCVVYALAAWHGRGGHRMRERNWLDLEGRRKAAAGAPASAPSAPSVDPDPAPRRGRVGTIGGSGGSGVPWLWR